MESINKYAVVYIIVDVPRSTRVKSSAPKVPSAICEYSIYGNKSMKIKPFLRS
jgi:hypothetical protein